MSTPSSNSERHRPMPDTNQWPAFTLPWNDTASGPADVSHLLHRPAGKYGFVKVNDGHLAFADGKRLRLWGTHFCRAQPFAPKELAPAIARRLAKFGINIVRMHAIDEHWPMGLFIRNTASTREFDPEAMDRFDCMVACLKDQGIYVDLNLHVTRPFSAEDGIAHAETVGWGKPENYYDPRMIELQKEYARMLLHHHNPYTNVRYADEPAVALIEITNENSLTERWRNGDLDGGFDGKKSNWGKVNIAYTDMLTRLWNEHLIKRYTDRTALLNAWEGSLHADEDPARGTVRRLTADEFAAAHRRRFHDEAAFYGTIERNFFGEMKRYIRTELGSPHLIIGNSDHSYAWSSLAVVAANAELDITDSHFYWQHPDNGAVKNTPMVDEPDRCAIAHLSRGAIEGYPHFCSEVNEPCPNDFAAEYIPLISAYGRLQDWDAIIFYDYLPWGQPFTGEDAWRNQKQWYWFDIANNPVKMAQIASGALMFLRGDAAPAVKTIARTMTREWLYETIRTPGDREHPYWLKHLAGRAALTHRIRIGDLAGAANAPAEGVYPSLSIPMSGTDTPADQTVDTKIVSDTGELTWSIGPSGGHVIIDTPLHQSVIGRGREYRATHCIVNLAVPFAAVEMISLDGKPIADSDTLLLVIGTRTANTGQVWENDARQKITDWGTAPTCIEPVTGTIIFKALNGAHSVTAAPLDGCGQPLTAHALPACDEGFLLDIALLPATVWYLIGISRA
ncbi:MAG: cellulase family glycosylhydrolase [Spirochaetes bacterium]|nr:cellulase family glycosylhydrolase [Spirochaetota bacterium]